MSQRYVVFDVETPNSHNDRMSAIGITVVEDGCVADSFYSLVNPDAHFDPFNIQLTGITPAMVEDQPNFAELWQKIEPMMNSGLLVAHNARFDMSVLAKCLSAYEIQWHPYAYYTCTCEMGRACYPELEHHKLNTLCDYLSIKLDHHDAGSDSLAAAKLLLNYMNNGMNVDEFIYNYDFQRSFSKSKGRMPVRSETTMQLLSLKAVLKNITADGQLSDQEVHSLRAWMAENQTLRGNFPFDKIFAVVESALADGVLASDELQNMLQLFAQVTDPVSASASCESFSISGKTFCLTGEFVKGSRSLVEQILVQQGGTPSKSVTKKTDYVIVGSQGSDAWSAGNYGTKVKKALELQEKGVPIQIVKEADISL